MKTRRLSCSGADEFTAVDTAVISRTQDLADNFHRLGVYPQQVDATTWLADSRFDSIKSTINTALAN
ncbi:hypothetical protein RQCS_58630 (plasmid) [Rhodococcus qingshengii]|uniref:hypothetical protein n=1 Tax=Rhodococcus qingshengii TaxID=334542 RepID=UPI0007E58D9C|nr:hypothetical protein [Rhodococcus qingshengii]BCF86318.1 hypothetical protein RQCS_58630 [Rhodococcus qingshengii]